MPVLWVTSCVAVCLQWMSHIRYMNMTGPGRGNLGVAIMPGTDRVLDRDTNQLVPCTPQRCPYAQVPGTLAAWAAWQSRCTPAL